MSNLSDFLEVAEELDTEPLDPLDTIEPPEEECLEMADLNQVEVTAEKTSGRQRRISARIQVPFSAEQLWQILTDYEHLADFIPNLTSSRTIEHPSGGIRIEQVGAQSFLRLKFCARVVLDMVEHFPHQIDFQMVEGDFKQFFGHWHLHPLTGQQATELSYTVNVLPPLTMPIALIERRLKHNLAVNLIAIQKRAQELFGSL